MRTLIFSTIGLIITVFTFYYPANAEIEDPSISDCHKYSPDCSKRVYFFPLIHNND